MTVLPLIKRKSRYCYIFIKLKKKKKGRIFKNEKGNKFFERFEFCFCFLMKSFRLGLGSYLLLVLG